MSVKLITSRANPTFKALKSLVEDAREQRRQGMTLLEGAHLVVSYRDKLGLPLRVIVSEHGAAAIEIRELCNSLTGVETIFLRNALYNELSGLATPTGVSAIIPIPVSSSEVVRGSCVLLDGLQDAGNVGSILRTAAAAGIDHVFLGTGCAGVWTPRVLRAAQGAHFDLCLHEHADLSAVMAGFSGITLAATAHDGEHLYRQDLTGSLAWLFGSEGRGISSALEAAAQMRVMIPLAQGCESLNVTAAAAICLFEEVRQKSTLLSR